MMRALETRNEEILAQVGEWVLSDDAVEVIASANHALERECLRVDQSGRLSQRPHPEIFGHPLTHTEISTDFSESQLELITGQYPTVEGAIAHLSRLHGYLHRHLEGELLWPLSAPCRLPDATDDIPLAYFGDSPKGIDKALYRRGLSHRYGRRMQTLSGIHYNFSFGDSFWKGLSQHVSFEGNERELSSLVYLHITRNFLRRSWLLTYLFGNTPAFDVSYLPEGDQVVGRLDPETWYAPYSTSLRVSHIGYTSERQARLAMSYDNIEEYARDLRAACETPCPLFSTIGTEADGSPRQMNDYQLQIEAELYDLIRPKPYPNLGTRVADALELGGISYLEVRGLDVEASHPNGVSPDQMRFLHMLLLSCLACSSPSVKVEERWLCFVNQDRVALEGRREDLLLEGNEGQYTVRNRVLEVLDEMEPIAKRLDASREGAGYVESLRLQRQKVDNPSLIPSQRQLNDLASRRQSLWQYGLELAERWQETFLSSPFEEQLEKYYRHAAERSLAEARAL